LEHSRRTGVSIEELRRSAESYIEEIVPYFNLVSYYKVGVGVARRMMSALYEVVFSRENLRASQEGDDPRDATVFVMNHRSNADYVLFALCMSREVALSYAVGEWARIWPLEGLFKSFGSYFVRRGEHDPLYHQVLRRYVQLVTRGGLAQGFFIEGRLTRSGSLNPPKVGLLDNLFGVLGDDFEHDVRFVPVGINFDRVLEDRRLLAEGEGPSAPPGLAEKLRSLGFLLATLPQALIGRLSRLVKGGWKLARRRHLSLGIAAVEAGPSLGFREFFGDRVEAVLSMSRQERKPELEAFGNELLRRVAECIPVTPIPLFAAAAERCGAQHSGGADRLEVLREIRLDLERLRSNGAPVKLGSARAALEEERQALVKGGGPGRDLSGPAGGAAESDEADAVWRLASRVLGPRGSVIFEPSRVRVLPSAVELLAYYRRSIDFHLELEDDGVDSSPPPQLDRAALEPPTGSILEPDSETEPGSVAPPAIRFASSDDPPPDWEP